MVHWEITVGQKRAVGAPGNGFISESTIAYVAAPGTRVASQGYQEFVQSIQKDIDVDPCRVRREIPPQKEIPGNTGHDSVVALASSWLDKCKKHCRCGSFSDLRKTSWKPKRLIYVGNAKESPHLITDETGTPTGPYAALSHCWETNRRS